MGQFLIGAVCEALQTVGRTHVGEIREGLPPMDGTPWDPSGRSVRRKGQEKHSIMN